MAMRNDTAVGRRVVDRLSDGVGKPAGGLEELVAVMIRWSASRTTGARNLPRTGALKPCKCLQRLTFAQLKTAGRPGQPTPSFLHADGVALRPVDRGRIARVLVDHLAVQVSRTYVEVFDAGGGGVGRADVTPVCGTRTVSGTWPAAVSSNARILPSAGPSTSHPSTTAIG